MFIILAFNIISIQKVDYGVLTNQFNFYNSYFSSWNGSNNNSCDESFVADTKHFDIRNVQRIGDLGLIFQTFLYNQLMGIIKQDYNKFRLYFEHSQKPTKDISLVIGINDNRTVNFITVRETQRNQRVRK